MSPGTLAQVWRFAVVGVVGYVVDAGILVWTTPSLGPYLGRILSFAAAVATTWILNRCFTFRARRGQLALLHELTRYVVVCLSGGAVNIGLYSLLVYLLELRGMWLPVAVGVGSLAGMSVNFTLSRRFVYALRHAPHRAH